MAIAWLEGHVFLYFARRGDVSLTLSFQTRRELLQQMVPRYSGESTAQKGALLDEIAATTGYSRRYAMWLLNHSVEGQHPPVPRRQRRYGPEFQDALFLAWRAANHICSKRLIPFLPTLIEALERHGHLHLTDACRSELLTMSAATADRLLHGPRRQDLRGISTTRAGTLLKQQIPVRTFAQWNETQPGFLEADLVAHCGSENEGSFLYTLTVTDLATGWTECLPLLSKCAEAVLSALQQARASFPFPILGLDTDNGSEFINALLLTYCEQEHITFTRGREGFKNDQCFVEQKNGAIVRQVIGYDRLEGEHAYQQLGEVYQALRLYVNGFQPSMKLQATQHDGRKVRRVYGAAKTPLQRLLLSKVLSQSKEQELLRLAQMLDPLRLFHHLQDLQRVLFSSCSSTSPNAEGTSPLAVFSFCIERCFSGLTPTTARILEGSWPEQVLPVRAPYSVSMGKSEQEAARPFPAPAAGAGCSCGTPAQQRDEKRSFLPQPTAEEAMMRCVAAPNSGLPGGEQQQVSLVPLSSTRSRHTPSTLTVEQAIQDYLEDQRSHHRSPKTIEWHEHALELFQRYLRSRYQCLLLGQITQAQMHGWLAFLFQTSSAKGSLRSTSTVESYARSARAFCQWLVHHRYLQASPFAHLALPKPETRMHHPLAPQEWEQLLLACRSVRNIDMLAQRATARNRAILWLLFDTGMRVSEVCDLRLSDVDREQGMLLIRGKGVQARRLTLGYEGLRYLRAYLDTHRLGVAVPLEQRDASQDHLFLSETGRPLTKNGIALLFSRLRKRAGISRKGINPSLLREGFALRFLQTGGDPLILQELLGYSEQATSVRYKRLRAEALAQQYCKEPPANSSLD
jgi:site-specific recombinase XerD